MFDLGFDSPSPAEVDPSQRAVPGAPTVITARALGNAVVMVRPQGYTDPRRSGAIRFRMSGGPDSDGPGLQIRNILGMPRKNAREAPLEHNKNIRSHVSALNAGFLRSTRLPRSTTNWYDAVVVVTLRVRRRCITTMRWLRLTMYCYSLMRGRCVATTVHGDDVSLLMLP